MRSVAAGFDKGVSTRHIPEHHKGHEGAGGRERQAQHTLGESKEL